MTTGDKAALRARGLRALREAPTTAAEAAAIAARVCALEAFGRARTVALYLALPGEPEASALWDASSAKRIVCAAMGERGPELRGVASAAAMARTKRGFFEPPAGEAIAPGAVDLWVVPGVAFDAQGVRLGRGGGYYDRLLAQRRADATVVGVATERQRVAKLPREPHDQAVNAVVTEAGVHVV